VTGNEIGQDESVIAVNRYADGLLRSTPTRDSSVHLDDTSARLQSDALLPARQ
jgi:hypothetical protein